MLTLNIPFSNEHTPYEAIDAAEDFNLKINFIKIDHTKADGETIYNITGDSNSFFEYLHNFYGYPNDEEIKEDFPQLSS